MDKSRILGETGDSRDQGIHKDMKMAWKKPKVTEISVGMEINCYACAEIDA